MRANNETTLWGGFPPSTSLSAAPFHPLPQKTASVSRGRMPCHDPTLLLQATAKRAGYARPPRLSINADPKRLLRTPRHSPRSSRLPLGVSPCRERPSGPPQKPPRTRGRECKSSPGILPASTYCSPSIRALSQRIRHEGTAGQGARKGRSDSRYWPPSSGPV